MHNWIHFVVWAVVIVALFGYLWWQGQLKRLVDYAGETREELKKCSWPSWLELRGSTILILASVLLLSAFVFVVDQILNTIFIH